MTNIQFQAFIDAGDGYKNLRWWEPEWLEAGRVDPEQPRSAHWTEANAPRESVTWYEAVAFCRWLDHQLRKRGAVVSGQQIRLPTEWEWQLAATGGDRTREYPWAGAWDHSKLNSFEGRLRRTTAIGQFPAGAAAWGALDMAGNVWEWCLNSYDKPKDTSSKGEDTRVLRGGSWFNDQRYCRAAYRLRLNPNVRDSGIGFRLCLSSPIVDD